MGTMVNLAKVMVSYLSKIEKEVRKIKMMVGKMGNRREKEDYSNNEG